MVGLWGQTALSKSRGVITSPLLPVIGMGLWTLITPCPKNISVALPRAQLTQRDISVKVSSLWREDVFFVVRAGWGSQSSDMLCPQSSSFRTDTGMMGEKSGHWDKEWVSAGNYTFETCQD